MDAAALLAAAKAKLSGKAAPPSGGPVPAPAPSGPAPAPLGPDPVAPSGPQGTAPPGGPTLELNAPLCAPDLPESSPEPEDDGAVSTTPPEQIAQVILMLLQTGNWLVGLFKSGVLFALLSKDT